MLGRALAEQAERNGDVDFLVFSERRWRYDEANALVNRVANALAERGLGAGDTVAVYMDSCPEYVFAALAANKLGAIWTPINTDYKGEWLADSLRRSRPAVTFVDPAHAGRLAELGDAFSARARYLVAGPGEPAPNAGERPFAELLGGSDAEPDQSAARCGDTCAVLWTSGTTGRAKGVMQSHNVWVNACTLANALFEPVAGDVIFNVMPLHNSAAWVTGVFRALVAGITVAVDARFSVADFWRRCDFYGATQAFTLGAMHVFLLNAPECPDDAGHAMRTMQCVPLESERADAFSRRFGVRLIGQGYSLSEAMGTIAQGHGERDSWPPNSCGNALDTVRAKLVDEAGDEVAVNEPGELWLKPTVAHTFFNGYFDDPKATEAAWRDGWFQTGDLLRVDEDGNYFFVDRKKDAVRFMGRNISTFEVEHAARAHPAVADCAAYGIPSELLDAEDELKLDVVVRPGESLSPEALARFIADNAPHYFVPRYIEPVDSLPYTPTNKVQKYRLRERGVTPASWDRRLAGFEPRR